MAGLIIWLTVSWFGQDTSHFPTHFAPPIRCPDVVVEIFDHHEENGPGSGAKRMWAQKQ